MLPFFLDSPQGPLFCIHHRPAPDQPVRGQLLVVNPFNEEMNRCRSMLTLQAQALAAQGVGTLVLDLFGTGDSAGEHGEASWDHWRDNLALALDWLEKQPGAFRCVLGIRLGAILAADLIARSSRRNLSLICWQAVVDGKLHFTQFLRIRIAARMDRPDLPKESTASLREELARGSNVEVGGYSVSPALAAGIEAAHLGKTTLAAGLPVLWLEHTAADSPSITPVSQKHLDAWASGGIKADVALFQGPAFWQMHERVVAPEAIAKTTHWVQNQLRKAA